MIVFKGNCSAWEVAAAYLFINDNEPQHYKEIWRFINSTNLTSLGLGGQTPEHSINPDYAVRLQG